MKRDKVISALWGFLLGFGISTAGVMCLVTAFDLQINTGILIGCCAVSALVAAVCYLLPLGFVPLGIGALLTGIFWRTGQLELSVEAILNRLSRQYDRAYGWGIIRWGWRTADVMEPSILLSLCFLGGLLAVLTAWAVCRKKTAIPALTLGALTLSACFVVTDTVPDVLWLYLLLTLFVVMLLTGAVRRQDEKQGNRLTLLVTPAAALALLVLFAVIPQDGYAGQDSAKKLADSVLQSDSMQLLMGHLDDGGAVAASTDRVDLKSVGYRMESQARVLEVKAPFTGTLYLRGRAMDAYDGVSWSNSGMDYGQYKWPSQDMKTVGEVEISTRFAHRMLYLPYYTDTMQLLELSDGMENETQLTGYSFACKRPERQDVITKLYPTGQSRAPEQYRELLKSYEEKGPLTADVKKWATLMAAKICGDQTSPYHKAQAIGSYVRNSATYDTRTPRMDMAKDDFAQWFLEESSTGYCVHFATATTVLLQAAGIPARYVTGYMTQVTEGEKIVVTSDQAHAWVEYWLPGYGWTVLESTPPDYSSQPEPTVGANVEQPEQTDETVPENPMLPTQTPEEQPKKGADWIWWLLLTVAGTCAVITGTELQRRIRRHLRSKKLEKASPNQKALIYWQEAALYARLLKEMPDPALYALAERAKFSAHTLTDAQLQQFEAAAMAAHQRLKKKNIFCRLWYRTVLAIY